MFQVGSLRVMVFLQSEMIGTEKRLAWFIEGRVEVKLTCLEKRKVMRLECETRFLPMITI